MALDLDDIQGLVLRGYRLHRVRHFVLRVNDAASARRFVGKLVSGDAGAAPQITSAKPWADKPGYCLNIGFTYLGLNALGVPEASLASFPPEFGRGPAANANTLGDTGESAPETWIGGFAATDTQPSQAHILLSLFAKDEAECEQVSARLRALFGEREALTEIAHQDGGDLPDGHVHFGYADGLSQPHVAGGPRPRHAGIDAAVPTGEFLLGYESQFTGYSYPVPTPWALGHNGSYFAYRIFRQDVVGFERFLEDSALAIGIDKEAVAAKLCGRWRNGVPITLSPDTDTPQPAIPHDEMNQFDYVPNSELAGAYDDTRGFRCPIGAHIRRTNPRGEAVAGGGGTRRRIIRRAKPYGPHYDPTLPYDGVERGLLMQVFCVSLADQFEFMMTQWVNGTIFAAGVGGKDALMGSNDDGSGTFRIPVQGMSSTVLSGFSRFVTTRGSAYCFAPSLTSLRYIACLPM